MFNDAVRLAAHYPGPTKDTGFPLSLMLRSSVMARSIASMVAWTSMILLHCSYRPRS